jgi:hypothetical protein
MRLIRWKPSARLCYKLCKIPGTELFRLRKETPVGHQIVIIIFKVLYRILFIHISYYFTIYVHKCRFQHRVKQVQIHGGLAPEPAGIGLLCLVQFIACGAVYI